MNEDRRYGDDEVRAIFGAAAEAPGPPDRRISAGEGLTLRQLQDIGREAGLLPESIAQAARALDSRAVAVPRRTYLGLPIAVGRTVPLARAPTDREWALLVSELRETFGARGRVDPVGGSREWRNGNLYAAVEPTETGYRLRLGTLKSGAAAATTTGAAGMAIGALLLATGGIPAAAGIVLAGGGAALASGLLRLPTWARTRERQMEYIAARARALTGQPADEP